MAGTGLTQPAPGEARLIPLGSHAGSPPISIKRPATLIGSRKDIARIHLESSTVSNAHAVIVMTDAGCYIHDLGSRTHVWVNGQKVVDTDLKDGDTLQIGRFSFHYQAPANATGKFQASPSAELAVSTLTDPLPLGKRVMQIGRRRGSDLQFDDDSVSNVHAILFSRNGRWCVRDINSRTGTWLNGKPIHQEVLADGATLRIGPATVVLNEVASPAAFPVAPPVAPTVPPSIAAAVVPVAEAIPALKPAPQISKPAADEPIDIEALALDSLAPETDVTDDEIAAELAKDDDAPLELDLSAEISAPEETTTETATPDDQDALPLADDSIAEAPVPAGAPVRAEAPEVVPDLPADAVEPEGADAPLELDLSSDTVNEAAIEAGDDATETIAEEDALASLRRGWHAARVPAAEPHETPQADETPEAEVAEAPEVTPVVEPAHVDEAPAAIPLEDDLEDEPVQIHLEPEASIDLPPAIELSAPIAIDTPQAEPVAETPISQSPVEEPATALLPVEDITDDDGAIDLPDAAPAPVAGALVEPELALESDDAGLDEPETLDEAVVEPDAELSELEAVELESPNVAHDTADAALLADESEDEIDLSAAPEVVATEGVAPEIAPADVEAAEAVAAEPLAESDEAPEPIVEARVEDLVEPVSAAPVDVAPELVEDTLETADLEEVAEAVIAPPPVAAVDPEAEVAAPLADHVAASDASEALFDEIVAEASSEESLASIDDWLADAEAEVDATVAEGVAAEPSAETEAPEIVSPEVGAPEITAPDAAAVADEGLPAPVADLEGVDFSDLTIEDDAASLATRESADTAPPEITAPPTPEVAELDLDVFADAADESPAAPLLNLADSVEGDDDFSPVDSTAGASVEIIEETLPTPASAMPEFDRDLPETIESDFDTELGRDSLELVDEVDLRELDIEEEVVDHAGMDTAMDVTPQATSDDDHDFEAEVETVPPSKLDPEPFEDLPVNQAPPPRVLPQTVARSEQSADDLTPPAEGKLSDLIPSHGPMVGGAFVPMPQQFLVGGSSLVDLTPEQEPGTIPTPSAREGNDKPPRAPFATPESPDRRRPLRVGFGGTGPAPAQQPSPFAGQQRTIAEALVGRTGQRSVDVFANPSPTPEDLLLNEHHDAPDAKKPENGAPAKDTAPSLFGATPEERELQETADRFRPRGSIGALADFPQHNLPVTHRPEDDPIYVAKLRKSRLHRVLACVILMVPLIGGAVAGVYKFVPPSSQIDAIITFSGLDRISAEERRNFKGVQSEYLRTQETLNNAVVDLGPDMPKGFLNDPTALRNVLSEDFKERWPENSPNAMRLRIRSTDRDNDRARLTALATALIKANDWRTKKADAIRSSIDSTTKAIQTRMISRDALDDQIRQIQAIGDAAASQEEIDQAKSIRTGKENELKTARTKRMDIESAIQLLQTQTPAELAPSPAQQLSEKDESLKKLNEELATLQKENESARAKVASENEKARKALDEVITQLEKELEAAQKLKDNPELVKYVTGAKNFFAKTRTLTDELLQRQVDQFDRLNELKTRLEERIEAHRRNTLANDVDLKKMSGELAMLERQKNAASQDYPEEAKTLDLKMKHLQSLIAGREEVLNKDPLYAQVITDMQTLVEQTAKNIRDDRKHIDESLTKAQEDFQNSTPAVEKMPAEQKQLAEAIEKKLLAVNEARKAYSKSADAAEAEQIQREKELKEKMTSVQQSIFARKQVVEALAQEEQALAAEANRKKRLEEKKLELAQAQEQEKAAQAAFDEADKKIAAMNDSRRTRQENELARDKKVADRDELDQQIQKYNADLGPKQRELAGLVVPDQNVQVHIVDDPDRRPVFMGAAAGAMFVLMLIPIVWNLRLISRDSHPRPAAALPVSEKPTGFEPVLADDEPDTVGSDNPDDTHTHPEDEPAVVR